MMYGTAARLNEISIGMPKEEVIKRLGNPSTTATDGNSEYMIYHWVEKVVGYPNFPQDYFVSIKNGHVFGYGRKGDFGTTRNPGMDINVQEKIEISKPDSKSESQKSEKSDYEQLDKLYRLKQEGAITEDEYLEHKKKLLSVP